MKILDVGCGRSKSPGAVGIDISDDTDADVVHDLNVLPWPLPKGEFERINCQDVLEHLDDVVKVMEELHRVAAANAVIHIRVPHFSSVHAFTDITHRHFFSSASFDYFTPESLYPHYSPVRFAIESRRLTLWRPYRLIGIEALANRFPTRYEKMFAFVFPAQFIEFDLRKR